jgi:hypothetical protein
VVRHRLGHSSWRRIPRIHIARTPLRSILSLTASRRLVLPCSSRGGSRDRSASGPRHPLVQGLGLRDGLRAASSRLMGWPMQESAHPVTIGRAARIARTEGTRPAASSDAKPPQCVFSKRIGHQAVVISAGRASADTCSYDTTAAIIARPSTGQRRRPPDNPIGCVQRPPSTTSENSAVSIQGLFGAAVPHN